MAGFFGGGAINLGGFFGGAGSGGVSGGGAGGMKDWGIQNGFLGGGANGNAFGMPDPLDIMGNRDKYQQAEAKKVFEQNRQAIENHWGNRPEFASSQNPDGSLKAPYQMTAAQIPGAVQGQATMFNTGELDERQARIGQVTPGTVGTYTSADPTQVKSGAAFSGAQQDLNAIRQNAFGTGPSAWAQAASKQIDDQTGQARQQMSQQQATANAQAQNDLAMYGGMDSGARERMARSGAQNEFAAGQGLLAGANSAKLGLATQDAQMKQQQQMQLPGMGLAVDSYDTGLQAGNVGRSMQNNQFNAGQKTGADVANVGNGMAAQQFNIGTDMGKLNMWAGQAQANADRETNASFQNAAAQNGVNQWNTGAQNNAAAINVGNALANNQAGNQYGLDAWSQYGNVLGAQATAQQMQNAQQQGGFFSKLIGGFNA